MQQSWKALAARRIRALSAAEAAAVLARIQAKGLTIDQPAIRELTGGLASQSINFHVMRLLGRKAGIIKGR